LRKKKEGTLCRPQHRDKKQQQRIRKEGGSQRETVDEIHEQTHPLSFLKTTHARQVPTDYEVGLSNFRVRHRKRSPRIEKGKWKGRKSTSAAERSIERVPKTLFPLQRMSCLGEY